MHVDKFLERERAVSVRVTKQVGDLKLLSSETFGELDVRSMLDAFHVGGAAMAAAGWGGGRVSPSIDRRQARRLRCWCCAGTLTTTPWTGERHLAATPLLRFRAPRRATAHPSITAGPARRPWPPRRLAARPCSLLDLPLQLLPRPGLAAN
jgi:hypothetical protein